jgi:diacylglycerol kinase
MISMASTKVNSKENRAVERRLQSFVYAFEGWAHVLRTQPNAWIHSLISAVVIAMAFWLGLSRLEWAILILAMMVVWMAELFNTALEAVVDIVTPEYHPLAKTAKDVAAATVLVGAIGSIVIGLLILGPLLWQRLFN